jgi:hypothetical protein
MAFHRTDDSRRYFLIRVFLRIVQESRKEKMTKKYDRNRKKK